jgi:F-type H+-transporting ATPase subunit b
MLRFIHTAPGRRLAALAFAVTPLLAAASASAAEGGSFDFGGLEQPIASLVIFGILLFILGKWAWKPILSQLEAREKKIADTIEQARLRQEEAQKLLAEYQAKLAAAEEQAAALLTQSRKEANTAREKILQHAAEDAQRTAEQLRREIEAAKQEAMREAYDSLGTLATEIAGKIIRRNLRPEDQKRIVEESLQEIRGKVSR